MKGDAILTSERLDFLVRPKEPVSERTILIHHIRPVDLETAVPVDEAIRRVLEFVGPRPLVGYFLEFDVGMLNKYVRPLIGAGAAQSPQIEVSRLYYDWRAAQVPPGGNIDLRFETIRQRLDLPRRAAHDAFNDALLTAMMYLRLKGGWRPDPPELTPDPGGHGHGDHSALASRPAICAVPWRWRRSSASRRRCCCGTAWTTSCWSPLPGTPPC